MTDGYLLLEDGTRFDGFACAHDGEVTGEVVFNTSMTGYQESVTDPSYAGQIIVFTYPLVGNYGVSAEAMESDRAHARGVVMREPKNGEDVATAEGGWLDWLADCGVRGSAASTRAPWSARSATGGRCAAASSPPRRRRRRRASGSPPSPAWTAPTSPAR